MVSSMTDFVSSLETLILGKKGKHTDESSELKENWKLHIAKAETGEAIGRCLRTTRVIEKDEILFSISLKDCVSCEVFDFELRSFIKNKNSIESNFLGWDLTTSDILAITDCLLSEKFGVDFPWVTEDGSNSPAASLTYKRILLLLLGKCNGAQNEVINAYSNALPQPDQGGFEHLPIYWNQTQLDSYGPLISPMLVSMSDRLKNEIQQAFVGLLPVVEFFSSKDFGFFPPSALDTFNLDWITWAFCSLNSRTFDLSGASSTGTSENTT
eukprot:Awhi_evm1s4633